MQRSIRFPVDVNGARESSVLNSLCLARSRFHTGQKRRGISVEGKGGGGWTKMIWFVINCCHNKYNAFLFFFKVFNIYVYTLEEITTILKRLNLNWKVILFQLRPGLFCCTMEGSDHDLFTFFRHDFMWIKWKRKDINIFILIITCIIHFKDKKRCTKT